MPPTVKTAGYAALAFGLALLVHCANAFYIEPTYLGFESPADYADMAKVKAALGSWPWWFSGLAHLASGFLFPIIGLGVYALFKEARTVAAQIALARSWQAETERTGPKVHILTPPTMPTATRARFFPGEDRSPLTPPGVAASAILSALKGIE